MTSQRLELSLAFINERQKVKVQTKLKTPDDDEIDIEDTIKSISTWVSKQLTDNPNSMCSRQTTPLMSQAAIASLSSLLGDQLTVFLIADEATRYAIIHSMTVGYYLLKFLERKKITIETIEYPVTDEEIAEFKRVTERDCKLTRTILEGRDDPKAVVQSMIKQGLITKEDLAEMGFKDNPAAKKETN